MSLEQIRAFVDSSEEIRFEARNQAEVYSWVGRQLEEQHYRELARSGRGLRKRYMAKMTGLSRAQITRLIARFLEEGEVKVKRGRRHHFPARYTAGDVTLLAAVDEAHDRLSGPATRRILERAFHEFGDTRFARLAAISSAHIYNLRQQRAYREKRLNFVKTPAHAGPDRRAPASAAGGRPGYLRLDTVQQGDREGSKGVYHLNAVDEVTQWQVVEAVAQISELWLIPALEAMVARFPFRIRGFHSDNGSEFIHYQVARRLNKLLIEQTKSRPRHSNDNGLGESKNGAVIRKHIGFGYIAAEQAKGLSGFYQKHFNPYLNFHRPCGAPELESGKNGRIRRRYRRYATPWELLREMPNAAAYLQDGITLQALERQAGAQSDTATAMQQAKRKLFASFAGKKTA